MLWGQQICPGAGGVDSIAFVVIEWPQVRDSTFFPYTESMQQVSIEKSAFMLVYERLSSGAAAPPVSPAVTAGAAAAGVAGSVAEMAAARGDAPVPTATVLAAAEQRLVEANIAAVMQYQAFDPELQAFVARLARTRADELARTPGVVVGPDPVATLAFKLFSSVTLRVLHQEHGSKMCDALVAIIAAHGDTRNWFFEQVVATIDGCPWLVGALLECTNLNSQRLARRLLFGAIEHESRHGGLDAISELVWALSVSRHDQRRLGIKLTAALRVADKHRSAHVPSSAADDFVHSPSDTDDDAYSLVAPLPEAAGRRVDELIIETADIQAELDAASTRVEAAQAAVDRAAPPVARVLLAWVALIPTVSKYWRQFDEFLELGNALPDGPCGMGEFIAAADVVHELCALGDALGVLNSAAVGDYSKPSPLAALQVISSLASPARRLWLPPASLMAICPGRLVPASFVDVNCEVVCATVLAAGVCCALRVNVVAAREFSPPVDGAPLPWAYESVGRLPLRALRGFEPGPVKCGSAAVIPVAEMQAMQRLALKTVRWCS